MKDCTELKDLRLNGLCLNIAGVETLLWGVLLRCRKAAAYKYMYINQSNVLICILCHNRIGVYMKYNVTSNVEIPKTVLLCV